MTRIQIFSDSLSTHPADLGAALIDQAHGHGEAIECFDLATQAAAFTENSLVAGFLERSGKASLPLVLVDGEISLAGRFPTQAEFARWLGEAPRLQAARKPSECCGGCC